MVFSSPTFLFIFFPTVFLLNLLVRKNMRASNALLLVFSLLFYAWGEPVYVLLMALTTLVNFVAAKQMQRGNKKLWCFMAVLWSIGSLVFFKYTGFMFTSINEVLNINLTVPSIALPVGISFFTFQALSYVLDVYRGEAEVSDSYADVLLYISLFPQLIAGPIVKYHDVWEQIKLRQITIDKAADGFARFSVGLAKKVLVANTLAQVADSIYAQPFASLTAPLAWLGAIAYLFQIYFDFSGYSDMAIGLGKAFGFDFKENFNYPYSANSMQDFWRRWHISLSTWFKEYVYIPLGGNRCGTLRTGVNKLLVFLLTGLWHGASWNFVLWGLFHGTFLLLESYGVLKPTRWNKLFARVYTMLVVIFSFVLFRAETLSGAAGFMKTMLLGWNADGAQLALFVSYLSPITLFVLVIATFSCTKFSSNLMLNAEIGLKKFPARYAAAFVLLLLSAFCLSTASYNPFIYFRF